MEIKKSEKANLENKKLLFTEIGLVISLAVVLVAFEWGSREKTVAVLEDTTQVVEVEEMVPITQETPPPPPASAPKIPVLSDQIEIVDDDIMVDDDMFINLEDGQLAEGLAKLTFYRIDITIGKRLIGQNPPDISGI